MQAEDLKRRRASSEGDLLSACLDEYVHEQRVMLVPTGTSLFRPGQRMLGDIDDGPNLPVIEDPELVEVGCARRFFLFLCQWIVSW